MLPTRISRPSQHRPANSHASTQQMKPPSSFFYRIKTIVTNPFSLFGANEGDIEDANGKRKRVGARVSEDEMEGVQKSKRIRVDSPDEHQFSIAIGYLDPPPSSFKSSISSAASSSSLLGVKQLPTSTSMRSKAPPSMAQSSSLTRTMSEDPSTSQYKSYRNDRTLHPPVVNGDSRYSMPLTARDHDHPPPTPFRLRTSLTPRISPPKGLRREASAPPPLASLESRPKFVKPPPSEPPRNPPLSVQKTMSLGTYAEFQRLSQQRSPSRERMVSGIGSMASIQSDVTMTNANTSAGKAYHELEMFKRPIIPSRYKGSQAIPEFLRPKKGHVPIPLPRKDRPAKPSLGMADKVEDVTKSKHKGKPYAGQGGMSKLLARRKAEVEEDDSHEEDTMDDSLDADTSRITDLSEVDVEKSENSKQVTKTLAKLHEDNPFARSPNGPSRPFGRIGRVKEPKRPQSARIARPTRIAQSNKFSAAFDEDETDEALMDTNDGEAMESEPRPEPKFSAPAGFSFGNPSTTIEHDLSNAKEPPMTSLPFSFAKPVSTGLKGKQIEVPSEKPPVAPLFTGTSLGKTPEQVKETPMPTENTRKSATSTPPAQIPTLSAPVQAPSSIFNFGVPPASVSNPTSSAGASVSSTGTPSGVPNFFASSALLANKTPLPQLSSSGSLFSAQPTPKSVEDMESSLGEPVKKGEVSAGESVSKSGTTGFNFFAPKTSSEQSKPTEPKLSPLGFGKAPPWPPTTAQGTAEGAKATSSTQNGSANGSAPLFGAIPPKPAETGRAATSVSFGASNGSANTNVPAVSTLFGTPSQTTGGLFPTKLTEPTKAPTPSPSAFTFTAPSGVASKENIAPPPTDKQVASTSTTEAPKSALFSFAPPSINGTASAAANTSTVKPTEAKFTFGTPPISTSTSTEASKSPFSFGAPPATPPGPPASQKPFSFSAQSSSTPASAATVPAPFSFGTPTTSAPASTSTPFSFGTPTVARQVTPPNKTTDKEERMEESPTRMDDNVKPNENKPSPFFSSVPLGSSFSTGTPGASAGAPSFSFGMTTGSNPFATKPEEKSTTTPVGTPSFPFGRTAPASAPVPAPALTTSFSFGQKSDEATTPTSSFGAGTNQFTITPITPTHTTAPSAPSAFTFGAPSQGTIPNPFAPTSSQSGSAPSSPFQTNPTFSFGTTAPSLNPFQFGTSQPSSPANNSTALPQSPATTSSAPMFTFGPSSSDASGSTSGSLFNIGSAPPQAPGQRQIRRLPKRPGAKR